MCVRRSRTGGGNNEHCGEEGGEQKSQWRPSQSRKESILNCLLMGNRGFMYKRGKGIGLEWSDQEINGPHRRG